MNNGNGNGKNSYSVEVNGNIYQVEFLDEKGSVAINDEKIQFDMQLETYPGQYSVLSNNKSSLLSFDSESREGQYKIQSEGFDYEVEVLTANESYLRNFIKAAGVGKKEGIVKAPMPGKIVQVDYTKGEEINQGDGVIIMEAMKMENEIKAPVSGIIKKMNVKTGTAVEKGQVLFEIE